MLLKEYRMISYNQTLDKKPARRNIEKEEFENMLIYHIQNARYIENLQMRVNFDEADGACEEQLTYFAFTIPRLVQILQILKENSHICIMKNFMISSQTLPIRKNSEEREHQFKLKSNAQLSRVIEETLLSCYHLNSISITGIMINDLSGYLSTILSVSQQLQSIKLVRCTKELILSESFFRSNQNQLQGLEQLNLS